jgi:hypothetical protein
MANNILIPWEEHLRQVADARASLLVSLAVQEEKFFNSRHFHAQSHRPKLYPTGPSEASRQFADKSTWTLGLPQDHQRQSEQGSSAPPAQPIVAQLLQGVIEDDTARLREELNSLLQTKALLMNDIARLANSQQAEAEEAAAKEHAATQHRQAQLQRKATLAAFRLSSVASMRRGAQQASTADQEIRVPPLGPANCDSFFDVNRNSAFADAPLVGSSETADTIAKMQIAVKNEQDLFENLIELFKASVADDIVTVDQERLRHELKISLLESQLSKLLASEPIVAIIQGGGSVGSDFNDFSSPIQTRNFSDDDESDFSSDSDILVPSKDVEFMKAADGSIRLCVGLQSDINGESFDRQSVVEACSVISQRESKLQHSMDELGNILRQLEKCNDVFESELLCLRCKSVAAEMFLLWPCGHHYCLDCVYAQEQGQGGYCCVECRMVTYDTPVVATFANDLVARMAFKRSGFRTLFDVLGSFRRSVQELDGSLFLAIKGLYRNGIDPDGEKKM